MTLNPVWHDVKNTQAPRSFLGPSAELLLYTNGGEIVRGRRKWSGGWEILGLTKAQQRAVAGNERIVVTHFMYLEDIGKPR